MTRLALLALALTFTACGDDPAPVVADSDTVVVAPDDDGAIGGGDADVDGGDDADLTVDAPDAEMADGASAADPPAADAPAAADAAPAADAETDSPQSDPVPAAGPPEEGDQPLAAVGPNQLGVENGRTARLATLHIAGCAESEGNDWNTMETWATDYLDGQGLAGGGLDLLDLQPGCYQVRAAWDDGATMREQVDSPGGIVHTLEVDV